MSESEYSSNESVPQQSFSDSSSSDEDYGVVNLQAHAPYQDEPLAVPGQARVNYEEDKDGIPRETIEARFEKRIAVNDWYVIFIIYEGLDKFLLAQFSHF